MKEKLSKKEITFITSDINVFKSEYEKEKNSLPIWVKKKYLLNNNKLLSFLKKIKTYELYNINLKKLDLKESNAYILCRFFPEEYSIKFIVWNNFYLINKSLLNQRNIIFILPIQLLNNKLLSNYFNIKLFNIYKYILIQDIYNIIKNSKFLE